MKNRSIILDFLKGISIIAVVLYYAQLFDYGYLGVDIFLVIAGYLTTKSLQRMVSEERYGFFRFMGKRLARLWPLLICRISPVAGRRELLCPAFTFKKILPIILM